MGLRRRRTPRHAEVFGEIHRTRAWGEGESVSCPGSGLARTAGVREALRELVARFEIRSLLDAGCGDLHWLATADLPLERYVGVDVVPEVIEANRRRRAAPGLLATTFPEHENEDIALGAWRTLNLHAPPFSFPEPLEEIVDRPLDGTYEDKRLALWALADL